MLNSNAKPNRNLFLILFFALACDLGVRFANHAELMTADLASEADQACATAIHSGLTSQARTGGCRVEDDANKASMEARVKRVTRPNLSLTEQPQAETSPAATAAKAERVTITQAMRDAAAKTCKAGQTNCIRQRDTAKKALADAETKNREADQIDARNQAAARSRPAASRQTTEEDYQVDIITTASDCSDCRVTKSFVIPKNEVQNANQIVAKIRAEHSEQMKALKAQRDAAAKKAKDDEARAKAEEKLAKDKAECRVGPGGETGKDWKNVDRLQCEADRVSGQESREKMATAFNSGFRERLRRALESGTPEERERAREIAQEFARDGEMPRSVRDTAKAMDLSAGYHKRITDVTEQMAKLPANSPARSHLMARLNQIQREMQVNLGAHADIAIRTAQMTGSHDAINEYVHWAGLLTGSIDIAINPHGAIGQYGGLGRQQIGQDFDIYRRTLRGQPGDPLVQSQQQFNQLLTGSQLYVQNAINQINQNGPRAQLTPGQGPFAPQNNQVNPSQPFNPNQRFQPGQQQPGGRQTPGNLRGQPGYPTARGRTGG